MYGLAAVKNSAKLPKVKRVHAHYACSRWNVAFKRGFRVAASSRERRHNYYLILFNLILLIKGSDRNVGVESHFDTYKNMSSNGNLQDMLGFGDCNSSRGDISLGADLLDSSDSRSPSAYSVHQAMSVSTPRRQSHRPPPRRHSPQVTVAPDAPTGDENSPGYAIAFTPGRTKLNSQSLLALQVKVSCCS